jgi:biotin carboxylase
MSLKQSVTRRQVLFVFGSQACVPSDPLLAAKELGCRTTVLASAIPCGLQADLVDHFERADLNNPQEVLEAVQALNRARPIHAVVGYDDQAVPMVARVAAELGLPGHPVEAADAARDKTLMKQRFKAAGLPIASYTLAKDEDDAVRWATQTGYPVVVKPVRGSASQAVIRADDEQELRDAYRRVRRIVRDQRLDTGGRSDAEQLVESYIDGDEYSVEFLVSEGKPHVLCVFEKPQPLCGPFFEETIYVTPARLSVERNQQLQDLAIRAVKALGLYDGPAHCEIRLSGEGPFVLEIGARVIGGACSRVFRHALGEEIHKPALRLALGDRSELPRQREKAAGAMMLPIPGEGRLLAVRNIEQARRVPGIHDVIITASPGDVIIPFPEQNCYIGFLTASADTPDAAAAALERAASEIQFEIAPLVCENWVRTIDSPLLFEEDNRFKIRTLEKYSLEEARDIVAPIVAAAHFGEYPLHQALEKARECIHWLEEGNRGETAPSFWLVAGDYGVALGSAMGDRCYASCLGVTLAHRGQGVGEALVRSSMSLFAERGCRTLEVTVDPRNMGNMAFYKRLGFVPENPVDNACCSC